VEYVNRNVKGDIMAKKTTNPDGTEKARRTRKKVDVSTLDPLDARVHRMAQAVRVIKIAREFDDDTLAVTIDELDTIRSHRLTAKAAE
jgi:hypothetical protein